MTPLATRRLTLERLLPRLGLATGWHSRSACCGLLLASVTRRGSGGQLQNFVNPRGTIDPSRIAGNPGCCHGLIGDALKTLASNLHGAQAPRHAKLPDKDVKHGAGVDAILRHGSRDRGLAIRVDRFVPAHNCRKHDAGGMSMRNAEFGPEHVANTMARTHRHAAGKRAHR